MKGASQVTILASEIIDILSYVDDLKKAIYRGDNRSKVELLNQIDSQLNQIITDDEQVAYESEEITQLWMSDDIDAEEEQFLFQQTYNNKPA